MQTDDHELERFAGIDPCEICNGNGFGVTLYTQGCPHRCPGCHNPSTWDFNGGAPFDTKARQYLFRCLDKPYITRFTVSGGEPLESPITMQIIRDVRQRWPNKSIWVYTGYTLEEIPAYSGRYVTQYKLLKNIDVLVDGPFILAERDITLPFRGSRNQRIIDAHKTMASNKVVLWRSE